jgi:hypothetical protein
MAVPTSKFVKGYEPNKTWLGPSEDVMDLHVHLSNTPDGPRSISCWELQPGEYQEVVRTGKVYLHIFGHHPVVWVSSAVELTEDPKPDDEPSALARVVAEAQAQEHEALEVENARLREALEFYATETNYTVDGTVITHHTTPGSPDAPPEYNREADYGHKARMALSLPDRA